MARRAGLLLNRTLSGIVPERRIFVRSERETRYFSFSPLSQLGFGVVILGCIGWSGFATVSYVQTTLATLDHEARASAREEAFAVRLAAESARVETLEAELAAARAAKTAIAESLGAKQQSLVDTLERMQATERELAALRAERDRLHAARQSDAGRIARLESTLATDLLPSPAPVPRAATLAAASAPAAGLDLFAGTVDRVIAERDAAMAKADRHAARIAGLEAEIAHWEQHQERLLARVEEAARTSLGALGEMFDAADLDMDRILRGARRAYSGAGGPFEPLGADAAPETQAGDQRIAMLLGDLERVNLLRLAATRLPFAEPVRRGAARRTSGFGKRRDPINKRWSMHDGVDFAGPSGTAIHATASGVVTHAGRMRGYGKMVTIRHGFGYETRYAHLRRVRVKVGQRVDRGDRIGDMGNTGRSTGTHLHYEIRLDREPINPSKFIKAARNVL